MAQKDPKHNINSLLLGTGEFSFSADAVSVADARSKGYLDFGNIVAFTPNRESKQEDHFGSYRGTRRKDKTAVTESNMEYSIRCDEWNYKVLEALMGAIAGTAWTQAIQTAAPIIGLNFAVNNSGTQKWYPITVAGPTELRQITSVAVNAKVEGVDFEVDLLLGRIRFLINQTTDLTNAGTTVTAAAITAGTSASFLAMIPMGDVIKEGYGRLVVYDQYDTNKVALDHKDFSCQIVADSAAEIDGQGFAEITLRVVITDTVGTVYVRQDNNN